MRRVVVAVVLGLLVAGGCAATADKKKAEREDRLSASKIGGKFQRDDPLVQMLSPEERVALDRAGMLAPGDDEIGPDGEPIASDETSEEADEGSAANKAGGIALSVLSVVLPIGMAVAPYLLF